MRRLLAPALLLIALLVLQSGGTRAQPPRGCDVMIDASGSMRGFASPRIGEPGPGSLHLGTLLGQVRAMCPRAFLFGEGTHPRPLPAGAAEVFEDGKTNIGANLRSWSETAPDGAMLILVTDNVEDTPGSESRNRDFYDLLSGRQSPFAHITVFALRAPFDGTLYPPEDRDPQGAPAPRINYPGPRAFTIYLLAKRGADDRAYGALRTSLTNLFTATGRRPFGAAAPGSNESFAVFDVRPFARETMAVRSGNVRIIPGAGSRSQCQNASFDARTGTFSILDQPMEQACDVQASVKVRIPDRWCLNRTSLHGSLEDNRSGDTALDQTVTVLVEPPTANLCAGEQDADLTVTVRFSPYRFREGISFWDRLTRAFRGNFRAQGRLVLVGTIERPNVNLGREIGNEWSFSETSGLMSPDPLVQRRVYRLDEAIRAVIPDAALERLELASYDVKAEVRYDALPVAILLGALLILLALLALLLWLARKPLTLLVDSDDGADTIVHIGLLRSARVEAGGSELHINIRNLAVLLLMSSNGRIKRGRLLGRSGGNVEAAPRAARGRRAPPDMGDGFDSRPGEPPDGEQAVRFRIRAASGKPGTEETLDDSDF